MRTETASEYPNTEFEIITSGTDKRLQWRIGEMVKGEFKYSYTDFTNLIENWIQLSISKDGAIKLNLPLWALWFKGLPDEIDISKWETFKIHRQIGNQIILEITHLDWKKSQIPIRKEEINKTP